MSPKIKTVDGREVEVETDSRSGITKRKGWNVAPMADVIAAGEDKAAEMIARAEGTSVKKAKDKLKKARAEHERNTRRIQ